MRHFIGIILLIIGLYSCDKLPKNGDLDGMWHLQRTTHLKTNPPYEENVATQRIYWSVQRDLLQITSYSREIYYDEIVKQSINKVQCRFEHTGTSLNINKIYLSYWVKDSLLTDPTTRIMEPFGIMGCADTFHIEHLGSKQMILVSDDKRLVFRKF